VLTHGGSEVMAGGGDYGDATDVGLHVKELKVALSSCWCEA